MEATTTRQAKELRPGNRIKLTPASKNWHTVQSIHPVEHFPHPYRLVVVAADCQQIHLAPDRQVVIDMAGMNIGAPMKDVRHADLTRVGDSQHTSECPSCGDGVLTMKRSPSSGKLQNSDFCTLCGQAFWYTDLPNDLLRNAGEMDVMKN